MAIVLKYGAPGPVLLAGFAAGKGHRENKLQDDALKRWQQEQLLQKQQNFQAGQNALAREQTVELAKIGREFQAGQQQAELQFRGEQADLGRNFQEGQQQDVLDARAAESDLDRKQRLIEQQRQQDFIADQHIQTGLQRGELTLPEAAQKRLRQLEAGRVDAMKLAPAEQQEFQQSYDAEKRQLLRLAQPVNEIPYDERVKGKLGNNYEQFKNLPWQFNDQGEMSLPSGFKMPGDEQAKAATEFRDGVVKRYEKLRGKKNEDTGELLSDEEAQRQAVTGQIQVEQFRQRLSGGGAQQPAVPRIGGPVAEQSTDPRLQAAYGDMQSRLARGERSWTADAGATQGADFDKQWASLGVGESLRGPDGKIYIKRKQ
jgi:hypothetical protein